jgi:hypothetical protein
MGRIEIEKGRWGFIFDGAYLKLGGSEDILAIRDTRFPNPRAANGSDPGKC